MSKALPAGRSWPSLPDLDLIASQTRLIKRKSRKFTAAGFLQSLLSSVATGLASLNQIVGELGDRTPSAMARQSLHKRLGIRSTAFLMAVLGDLMQQRYRAAATVIGNSGIQRILIEDASGQVMPKSNAEAFPAHGNHYGKTAGVKIDFAFDLLAGSVVSHSLQGATEQDKSIGREFVVEVRRGDLVLRDMGYFSLGEFTEIERREAWWLTRLPLTAGVLLADGRDLETYLKSFRGNFIDLDVIVGEQGKILHSKDAGETWELQPSVTNTSLFAIAYRGGTNIWIAGRGGAILRRVDPIATVNLPAVTKLPPILRGSAKADNVEQFIDEKDFPKAVPPKKPVRP